MPAPGYSEGTISVPNDSSVVTGVGTAWTTTVKPGDVLVHSPAAAAPIVVGHVDSVDTNLQITLVEPFRGTSLFGVAYYTIRGYSWWTGAAPNETLVQFLTELGPLGLAGASAGPPDPDEGRENEIRVDYVNNLIYQRRSGVWSVAATGDFIDAFGYHDERVDHDDEDEGFTFFSIDEEGFYVKLSITPGSWSDLVSLKGADGATVQEVLDELGIHAITISEDPPSGGQHGDLWFKVTP